MQNPLKIASPAMFGVVLICFLLPFLKLGCAEQELATYTGVELMIGTRLDTNSGETEKIEPNSILILAFLVAGAGIGLSFVKAKMSPLGPALAGLVGIILLFAFKFQINHALAEKGEELLWAKYPFGYWLALVFFLAGGVLNFIFLLLSLSSPNPAVIPESRPPMTGTDSTAGGQPGSA